MEICRVCLTKSNMLLNFTSDDCQKFLTVTGIEIKSLHDEFLCSSCLKRLVTAFEFQEEARINDKKLNEINSQEEKSKNNSEWSEFESSDEELSSTSTDISSSSEESSQEEVEIESRSEVTKNESENKPKCPICNKEFQYKTHRDLHVKEHQTTEKSFLCTYEGCDKKYALEHSLKQHIEVCHINQQKFICEFCARVCASQATLVVHRRIHTGEKPFKCPEPDCTSTFRRHSDLYYHQATHSNERPHVCVDCGSTYKLRMALRNHRRLVHKVGAEMLKCPDCDKEFLFMNHLKSHQAAIHRGERNFACKICTKTYTNGYHLKRHYRDSHPENYDEFVAKQLHYTKNNVVNTGKNMEFT